MPGHSMEGMMPEIRHCNVRDGWYEAIFCSHKPMCVNARAEVVKVTKSDLMPVRDMQDGDQCHGWSLKPWHFLRRLTADEVRTLGLPE